MSAARSRLDVALGAAALVLWMSAQAPVPAQAAAAPAAACGSLATSYDPLAPPVYQHIVVLMEENWSYRDFLQSTQTPFLTGLTHSCGDETDFHAATHSSQPNYMAATSGVASGVGAHVSHDNVFHQVQGAGLTWRSYEESMAGPCSGSGRTYKRGHNPALFYTDLRAPEDTCTRDDVPLNPALDDDIAADALPAYSFVTPNLCHDFHWASGCGASSSARFREGDQWLAALLPRLTALPSYLAGETLIVITFDEGRGGTAGVDCTNPSYYVNHPDCQIPTVVVSPYLAPGAADASDQNLYSLLGTTEDLLELPRLGRAVGRPSMRATMPF